MARPGQTLKRILCLSLLWFWSAWACAGDDGEEDEEERAHDKSSLERTPLRRVMI